MNGQHHQTNGDFYGAGFGLHHNNQSSSSVAGNGNLNGNMPRRQGYATTVGLPSGLSNGRHGLEMNPQAQQTGTPSLYDDRFTPFDTSSPRFDRAPSTQPSLPNGAFTAAFHDSMNPSPWGYTSTGAAATLGGPVNDGSRMRPNNRRPALHPEWTSNNDLSLANSNSHLSYHTQQQTQQHSMGQVNLSDNFGMPYDTRGTDHRKEDLILTAIVIKNIPFNVRKETLTSIMVDLGLPQPYAFNYHFDNGVFRGLAFANFQNANDTKLVIDSMNGMDIHGRKLRVEYKKMLPEAERERIERDKREKRGQLEEQHRGPVHQASMTSMVSGPPSSRTPVPQVGESIISAPSPQPDMNDPATLAAYVELTVFAMDDKREVHIFPADMEPERRRVVHILAQNMGLYHVSLGEGNNRCLHVSKKENDLRPHNMQQTGVPYDGHPRGLNRAATFDFTERQQQSGLHAINTRSQNLAIPNTSPDGHQHQLGSLRNSKSVADLRAVSSSPSAASHFGNGNPGLSPNGNGLVLPQPGGAGMHNGPGTMNAYMSRYVHPDNSHAFASHAPNAVGNAANGLGPMMASSSNHNDPGGLSAALSGLGLGSSPFETGNTSSVIGSGRASAGPVPGAIGSQRPSANSGANGARAANPERQPRGPNEWDSNGFARARSNGHMHRASDSSDNNGNQLSSVNRSANGHGSQFGV